MKTLYSAVCDEHKEYCDIIINGNYNAMWSALDDITDIINAFLLKHIGCKLRLIHENLIEKDIYEKEGKIVLQIEELYEEYLQVNRDLKDDERDKYLKENNVMRDGVKVKKRVYPPGNYYLILKSCGEYKLQVIKIVRGVTNSSLRYAKKLVDDVCAGTQRKIEIRTEEKQAYEIKTKLEKYGASVEVIFTDNCGVLN